MRLLPLTTNAGVEEPVSPTKSGKVSVPISIERRPAGEVDAIPTNPPLVIRILSERELSSIFVKARNASREVVSSVCATSHPLITLLVLTTVPSVNASSPKSSAPALFAPGAVASARVLRKNKTCLVSSVLTCLSKYGIPTTVNGMPVYGLVVPIPTAPAESITKGVVSFAASST